MAAGLCRCRTMNGRSQPSRHHGRRNWATQRNEKGNEKERNENDSLAFVTGDDRRGRVEYDVRATTSIAAVRTAKSSIWRRMVVGDVVLTCKREGEGEALCVKSRVSREKQKRRPACAHFSSSSAAAISTVRLCARRRQKIAIDLLFSFQEGSRINALRRATSLPRFDSSRRVALDSLNGFKNELVLS